MSKVGALGQEKEEGGMVGVGEIGQEKSGIGND